MTSQSSTLLRVHHISLVILSAASVHCGGSAARPASSNVSQPADRAGQADANEAANPSIAANPQRGTGDEGANRGPNVAAGATRDGHAPNATSVDGSRGAANADGAAGNDNVANGSTTGASSSVAPGSNAAAVQDEVEPVNDPPEVIAVNATHPDPTRPDPMRGRFSLAQATQGLAAGGDLVAEVETTMGTFTCSLLAAEAPITVANFVGLARGTRPFWDPVAGRWLRRPYYDGSAFHRVIPNFVVQGGDILRTGRGGPGYTIRDENVSAHDAAGQLCMANRGPNTGGSQFFITERPLRRLDGSYSVFGRCSPIELVRRMARVPRSPRDQPVAAIRIVRVTIRR